MPNLYRRGDTWWARFKVEGIEYRRSLRTTVRGDAERRLKAFRKEIEDEVRFGLAPPQTWQSAVLSWRTHATRDISEKTVKRYLVSLKQIRHWLDDTPIHRIDVAKLREMVKGRRVNGASTATIRRDLTAISSVLDHAIEEGWIDGNPTLTIRHRRMREKRQPIVLPNEADIEAVKAKAPPRLADAIDLARETGMRLEEIFGLTHRQVGDHAITIERAKHNSLRVIPLSAHARRIIKRQPQHISSPYVFWQGDGKRWASPSSSFGNVQRRVARAAQKAAQEYRWFRFHDLRHLFAVEYLRAGRGSLYDLQRLMGHTSVTTTEIYLKYLTPEQVKAAMHGVGTNEGTGAAV